MSLFFFRNLICLFEKKTSYKKKDVCVFCFSSCGVKCLEGDLRVAGADKVEQLLAVLADEGLLVVASDVVPLDAIVVEVVQDGQARLTLLRQQKDRIF